MSREGGPDQEPTADGVPDGAPVAAPDGVPEPVRTREAVVRRAPRFRRFVGAGVVLALIVGLVLWAVWDGPQGAGAPSSGLRLLWIGATAAAVGAVLGALVAVAADARSARRSTC